MRCAHGQQVYGRLWRWSLSLRMMSSRNRMGRSLRIWMGKPFHQEKRLRLMKVAWRSPTKAPLSLNWQLGSAWHGCICKRQRWPETIFWSWTKRVIVILFSCSIYGLHCPGVLRFSVWVPCWAFPWDLRIGLMAGLIRLLGLWDLCHPWLWSPWWSFGLVLVRRLR